jgi:hypothetical protein
MNYIGLKIKMEKFKKEMIDWEKVRDKLKELTGKEYSKGYIMGVRNGNHSNKKVFEILKEMGIV